MKKRFRRLVVFITLMSMIMAFTVPVTAQDDVQSLTPENIYENVDPNGPLDTDVPGDPDLPIVPVQPDEPVIEPGFHCDAEGNVTYYDENGVMARGWRTIGGYKYFFSKQSGAMLKGIYRIGDYKYFFSRVSGRMLTGLVKSRGNVYNIDSRGRIQRTIYGSKKAVALTYDDGPASGTKSIVKVLKDNNSVATFFVVGNRADIYSDSIKAASNAGCQIGCHTYSHPWLSTLSPSGISSQIKRGCSAVKRITGTSPTVCRTPGGETGSTIRNNVGMPIILWSVDTRDWATQDADSTYSAVINHVSDGDIVLMHDLHSSTATASKRIIPKLRKMGYQLVTVEELALLKGVNLKAGKVYYKF
ncbi:MAG: polysaccharide deacetylase family protein [Eubacteriaceae bacterium]|nr:polysaccharide deacetylase family protein [Eubacteriaceae bacterium]